MSQGQVYRFTFGPQIEPDEAESRLVLAALNTENVYGETAMRLDASFRFDKRSRICEVDGRTEIGQHIARLFTAYLSQEFGDSSFTVERAEEPSLISKGQKAAEAGA